MSHPTKEQVTEVLAIYRTMAEFLDMKGSHGPVLIHLVCEWLARKPKAERVEAVTAFMEAVAHLTPTAVLDIFGDNPPKGFEP